MLNEDSEEQSWILARVIRVSMVLDVVNTD